MPGIADAPFYVVMVMMFPLCWPVLPRRHPWMKVNCVPDAVFIPRFWHHSILVVLGYIRYRKPLALCRSTPQETIGA